MDVCLYVCTCVCITVYGKTFEWENFAVFVDVQPIAKVFPLNYLLCTVHNGHGLMHRGSFPVKSVFCAQLRKFSHLKVLPYTVYRCYVCATVRI